MVLPLSLQIAIVPATNIMEIVDNGNGSISISGIEGKFLEILCWALKIKYTIITSEDNTYEYGSLNEFGNWIGMLGLLERNEADIAFGLAILEERRKAFDFSIPYATDEITFMTAKDRTVVNKNRFWEPFNVSVWLCILCSFFFASIAVSLSKNCSVLKVLFNFLSMLLRQSVRFSKIRNSIVYASWLLFTLVISSIYLGIFTSQMTLPARSQPLQTFVDVWKAVQRGTHRCLISRPVGLLGIMQTSEEHIQQLYKYAEENNWFFDSFDDLNNENIKDSVVIAERALLQGHIFKLGMESYELSNDVICSFNLAIAFRKDFDYKQEINKVLNKLEEAGIFKKLSLEQESKIIIRKNAINVKSSDERPTFAKEIYSLFIMALFMYCLAFIIFIVEVVYYRLHEIRKPI